MNDELRRHVQPPRFVITVYGTSTMQKLGTFCQMKGTLPSWVLCSPSFNPPLLGPIFLDLRVVS